MTYVPPPPLADRHYVSRFSISDFGLTIQQGDADADVTATFSREDNSNPPIDPPSASLTQVFQRVATPEGDGNYIVTTSSMETQEPGYYIIEWTFLLDTVAQRVVTYIEVGPSQPVYDDLSADMKTVVENVWIRFADLFDSPEGGANLVTYYQTNWSRSRVSQLMVQAVSRLNIIGQPKQAYTAFAPSEFPVAKWGGLLEMATYIECLKHLIRSYTEQPNPENLPVSRMDRRDYSARWGSVLQMEQDDFIRATDTWRIANMNLGKARVLVSGGAYGRFSPNRLPVSAAARPRFWSRFY